MRKQIGKKKVSECNVKVIWKKVWSWFGGKLHVNIIIGLLLIKTAWLMFSYKKIVLISFSFWSKIDNWMEHFYYLKQSIFNVVEKLFFKQIEDDFYLHF